MAAMVKRWVDSCDSCTRCKASNQAPYGFLQPLDIPNARWESVGADVTTEFPVASRGFPLAVRWPDREGH